jgi:hypothetical protein
LLQQTPADQVLADVLLAFPGAVRLIEFKRLENTDNKEKDKHLLLTSAIRKDDENTIKLSKSIHWFIETTSKEQTFVSRIVPYLEAYPRKNCQHSFEGFIETTADDAVYGKVMFSDEELSCYLALVGHCQVSATPNEKPNTIQPGGVLLRIDSRGNLRFGELTDMRQLLLMHREYVREYKELEHQQEQTIIQRDISEERSNSLSQGFEL